MEQVVEAIRTTPIIDNHAHPLLKPKARSKYPLLSITTEAHGDALKATTSSLSHLRAVRQLANVLGCKEDWNDVVRAIDTECAKPGYSWHKKCFEGIESVLIDDGLDSIEDVFDYAWHNQLTRSASKRIVRIEKIAESIISTHRRNAALQPGRVFSQFVRDFEATIKASIRDPEIVGFKSVICYRTGLDIPTKIDEEEVAVAYQQHLTKRSRDEEPVQRIDGTVLNAYLVHTTARLIQETEASFKKPLQFHTGLGDNDITLTTSSPSHLQSFIRIYPTVPIVLLHASYPWTKEAGYLASVYSNVYADIGEIFPMVSREGQEIALREILELCPSEKIMWSTDGHWFPETYLLAIIQVRQALEKVIPEYVLAKDLNTSQAITVVQDLLFNTANKLYDLGLQIDSNAISTLKIDSTSSIKSLKVRTEHSSDLRIFQSFLRKNPGIKFLRSQYVDYTSIVRTRVFPIARVLKFLETNTKFCATLTKASLGLLQNDCVFPNAGTIASSKEYLVVADASSLRKGPVNGYASVATNFTEKDGSEVEFCPRTVCHRVIEESRSRGLEFLIGFEIEVVFLEYDQRERTHVPSPRLPRGHAWGSAQALNNPLSLELLNDIFDTLANAGIYLEYFHPESAQLQYEFVLPPLPPLEAVDALIQARQIVVNVAAKHGLRATLTPKPFPMQSGTASHMHISIPNLEDQVNGRGSTKATELYESFYAGVLKRLPSILAFSYPQQVSYDRMVDSAWAGGTWISWGNQNRETALRQIEGSHWEVKVVDGLGNPYFVVAAVIAAGTRGVTDKEKLTILDCQLDPGTLSDMERQKLGIVTKLPKDLKASLKALKDDEVMNVALGQNFVQRYLNVKYAESAMLASMDESERRDWIIDRY